MTSTALEYTRPRFETVSARKKFSRFILERVVRLTLPEDETSQTPSFSTLQDISLGIRTEPESADPLIELANQTADALYDQLQTTENTSHRNTIGLGMIWDAANAWDTARTEPTEKLFVFLLNRFYGEGQTNLTYAFIRARDTGESFSAALDVINAGDDTPARANTSAAA